METKRNGPHGVADTHNSEAAVRQFIDGERTAMLPTAHDVLVQI